MSEHPPIPERWQRRIVELARTGMDTADATLAVLAVVCAEEQRQRIRAEQAHPPTPCPNCAALREQVPESVAASARVVNLYLQEFWDASAPYYDAMAEASRRAKRELDSLRAQVDDWQKTAENAINERCERSLQAYAEVTALREQVERLIEALKKSEQYRKAYAEGKGKLYACGGEIANAAIEHLPCNEGPLEAQVFRALSPTPPTDAATCSECLDRKRIPVYASGGYLLPGLPKPFKWAPCPICQTQQKEGE